MAGKVFWMRNLRPAVHVLHVVGQRRKRVQLLRAHLAPAKPVQTGLDVEHINRYIPSSR